MAASLDDLIKISTTPVFVDFWAAWCGPCKTVAPSVKKLADEFKGRLMVVKVNVDEQPSAASRFQVQGIPALMLFKDGEKNGAQLEHFRTHSSKSKLKKLSVKSFAQIPTALLLL